MLDYVKESAGDASSVLTLWELRGGALLGLLTKPCSRLGVEEGKERLEELTTTD
jgi:hypothetical protein